MKVTWLAKFWENGTLSELLRLLQSLLYLKRLVEVHSLIDHELLLAFSFLPISTKNRTVHHGNSGSDLRCLAPTPLDSFRRKE